ncbi:MAG: hypothetical protein CL678_11210 [Bdellovibrionaceae bacterium]|nr:hypothetical protein [Pseudobdellovibrionaceae bacterium]
MPTVVRHHPLDVHEEAAGGQAHHPGHGFGAQGDRHKEKVVQPRPTEHPPVIAAPKPANVIAQVDKEERPPAL